MQRDRLGDLTSFLAVAEERSFTRAAARLGTSQSALSHTVRRLETALGLRLLTRTTRRVAPTEAGERLIETLRPAFDDIDAKLAALASFRDRPSGTIRITSSLHAAEMILWPALARLLPHYPEVRVELSVDAALIDIVAERFDAGVRLGEQVAKDMIAIRIGPDLRMAVVGAPSYLTAHPAPLTPHDLTRHDCINLRLPTLGGLYAWELGRDGAAVNVRVGGRLVFNHPALVLQAAVQGFGLAFVLDAAAETLIEAGRLVRVLADWCPPLAGFHLYYPSRRQMTPAFALLVEALRYRGAG
jgi:DNA-binding transcriptional LysR family regulator